MASSIHWLGNLRHYHHELCRRDRSTDYGDLLMTQKQKDNMLYFFKSAIAHYGYMYHAKGGEKFQEAFNCALESYVKVYNSPIID